MKIRICAWCGATLGLEMGYGVTHGICRSCADKQRDKYGLAAAPTGRTHETHPRELGTGGAAFFYQGTNMGIRGNG